jgi:hypothetical protein
MKNDILTPRLVAEELGVNHATACTWCAKGWLKAKKVDGNWKITKEDLETFKKEHKQGHKREPKRGHKKGKGITINSNPKTKRPKLSGQGQTEDLGRIIPTS